MARTGQGGRAVRRIRVARSLLGLLCLAPGGAAWAGNFELFGVETDYKITLGYATAMRMEEQAEALINGPMDQMQIRYNATLAASDPNTLGIESLSHPGLRTTTNFDDGNRDFKNGALLNNRVSGFGQVQFKLDNLGLGDIGGVASGAAHYDQVYLDNNDHDNEDSVNRGQFDEDGNRFGPINEWTEGAEDTNGMRHRLLEAYVYGQWYLTDTIGISLRGGKHLAAWGESLFFPGIASAQGPFDATKAFVPGVEVKEILLPVNQVSMQLGLTPELTVLAYNQFEFKPTEVFPQGDFFSPADLIGPGAFFGYGSINPIHPEHCTVGEEVAVTDTTTGVPVQLAEGDQTLCLAGQGFDNKPEYINIFRTADAMPSEKDQWGLGLKYQVLPDLNLGGYYLRYNNHNPQVLLNMGYAKVGDVAGSCESPGGCQPVTTQNFNDLRVPTSYTVGYAEGLEMTALSFSTVFWVFNIGGEIIQRDNVDTSLEATISGVIAPVAARGRSRTAQMSFLYVNNPDFLMYDEVVVVGEVGYTQLDKVQPRRNEPGICMSGTSQADCESDTPQESGDELFYDKDAWAFQVLVLPKGRNVFSGWDVGTPLTVAWLVDGTPSTAGVFGGLYGEGDLRISPGVTAQFVQNLEFSLTYNLFLADAEKTIRNSLLNANPYTDKDYLALSVKYNL